MKQRLFYLAQLALFFIVYFLISRFYFQISQFEQTLSLSLSDILLTYIHGIRLDLSFTGYLMLLFSIMMILSFFIKKNYFRVMINVIVIFFIGLLSLIVISDGELYKHWGFRMDTAPLMYLNNPKLAMASTTLGETLFLVFLWFAYSVLFTWGYLKWVSPQINKFQKSKWFKAPLFLFVASFMILPIRGSLGIAPINTGMVYFSDNLYANHTAINVVWNLFYDLVHTDRTSFEVHYVSEEEEYGVKNQLIAREGETQKVLNKNRPNVIVIILESFTAKAIEVLGGEPGVTPNLNRLWNEGIAFNQVYATGTRSDRGLVAILSGYPSHPKASVMKYPQKTQQISSLCSVLNKQGYHSTYYYGGDTDFANMGSYLLNSGFSRIVNEDLFPKEFQNSKWGVHDEYMFQYLLNETDTATAPFYKVFFTLSSHEPFDVPMETVVKGDDSGSKYLNSVAYTDKCLGNFIEEAKKKEWWQNTLLVLVADHGVRYPIEIDINEPERYRIPMLWLGGVLSDTLKINRCANQFDIPATILGQMDLPYNDFIFSNDLFLPNKNDYALFIYNNGFGMVTSTGTVVYDLKQHKVVKCIGDTTGLEVKSKAMFQSMITNFNKL